MNTRSAIAILVYAISNLTALPVFADDRSSDILMIFAMAECSVGEKIFTPDQANEWMNKMIKNANISEDSVAKVTANPRVNLAVQHLISLEGGCKKIMSRL